MRTSNQNLNFPRRPTCVFWFLVHGWKDSKGKLRVSRTMVYTNKRAAMKTFKEAELINKNEFLSLYEVGGRTKYTKPEFTNKPLKHRFGSLLPPTSYIERMERELEKLFSVK